MVAWGVGITDEHRPQPPSPLGAFMPGDTFAKAFLSQFQGETAQVGCREAAAYEDAMRGEETGW